MFTIVATHKNTDFDALASLIAATVLYPDAKPVIPKNLNPNVKAFLSLHKEIFKLYDPGEINFDEVERLVVVDTNAWERLDRINPLKDKKDLEIIMWDHHINAGNIKPTRNYSRSMGANISLMTEKLVQDNKKITPIQATLFLAGLYEDTGNLTFQSTQPQDAKAAAFFLENKADLAVLNTFLSPAYGEKQKDILFAMLETAQRTMVNGYSVSFSRTELKGHVDRLAVVVRMYRDIINTDAAFGIFTNYKNKKTIIIGRSNVEGVNVGALMKALGGGGHLGAGSAILKSVKPLMVEQMLRDLIRGNNSVSVQISDLMSFPVVTVSSQTRMREVAKKMREIGCTGIPVVDDENLVGVISRRDFNKIKKDSQLSAPVKAFMQTNVKTIKPGKSPMQAARLMIRHDIGRLPVVANGKVIGILTRSDAMTYFYDLLPG